MSVDGNPLTFHLDVGGNLDTALNGQQLAFTCQYRPLPTTVENTRWPRSQSRQVVVLGR